MGDEDLLLSLIDLAPAPEELTTPFMSERASSTPVSGERRQVLANRYELLGLIAVGGMGSVYRARDRELEEIVALKMLRRELVDMPGMLDRFRNEAKLARRVSHVNVARMFDISEHEGEKFLTMEFIDGESLWSVLARTGPLEITRVLNIAYAVCAGLSSAHAAGVVHRDLKPDNVLLAKDGRVVITDFGVARALFNISGLQTVGMNVGTPAYMAPEQVEGRPNVDARADIYALGLMLYEMSTGKRAWTGDTAFTVAAARLSAPPPDPRTRRPDLPTSFAEVVLRCLARRPEERFTTVDEVIAELGLTTLPTVPGGVPPRVAVRSPSVTPPPNQDASPAPATGDKTVAVLPFRNAGPKEDAYLAEELTDDLIDNLSMTRGLKVRARGAVLKYRDVERDSRELGRELDVQVVVEGSVRRAHGNVRIHARLTSVADGFQLWAKRFDRPEQDVLSINDDAAAAIAAALTVDREGAGRAAPSNPAAVDLYLRARHEYRQFWGKNQERALDLFDQAEALAPNDPMILSGKALAMTRRAFFSGTGADQAISVMRQVLAAAPNLAEARLSLGTALLQTGDAKGAISELRQAVLLGPGLAEAHTALGRVLVEAGALREGMSYLKNAIGLDPDEPLAAPNLARAYALLGDWAHVEPWEGKARRLTSLPMYARFCLWRRDVAGMEALLAEARALGEAAGAGSIVLEGVLQRVRSGDREAPSFGPAASGQELRRRVFQLQLEIELRAERGELDEALDRLRMSVESGLFDLTWLDLCPLLAEMRADPRFGPLREVVEQRAEEIMEAYRRN
jgi:eukaryotic-like serine/threonine-protein kinase